MFGVPKYTVNRHTHFLLKTHKYRKMADSFDGMIEKDFAPQPAMGTIVF
jgi:hypothetical protein